ncbi:hypothetical protein IAD21_00268 [Abditibacteriota bacterium]|nr:hypothetical protein IAD21_00268 [Abditibacteriota bacterium]
MKNVLRILPIAFLASLAILLSVVSISRSKLSRPSVPLIRSQNVTGIHSASIQVTPAQKEHLLATVAALPLLFERNQGQFALGVPFGTHGSGYGLTLSPKEVTLSLFDPLKREVAATKPKVKGDACGSAPTPKLHTSRVTTLRMTLVGANPSPRLSGQKPLPTKINYFLSKDQSKWRRNVSTFGQVRYHSVYPGVDLVYYGNAGHLEYDFLLAPNANPNLIRLSFSGADTITLDARGDLLLRVDGKTLTQHAPVIYQLEGGVKKLVAGRYLLLSKNEVGFQVGAYNTKKALVIDPVLAYSTYIDGSGTSHESLKMSGIALDGRGNIYVTGTLSSAAPGPLLNATYTVVGTSESSQTPFVAKLSPNGASVLYLTFFGSAPSNAGTESTSLAVDGTGEVFAVGFTHNPSFPTPGGFQTSLPVAPVIAPGRCGDGDLSVAAFLVRFDTSGALQYGTFLVGLGPEDVCPKSKPEDGEYSYPIHGETFARAVTVSSDGLVAFTGSTEANDLPVLNAVQPYSKAGRRYGGTNAFVAVMKNDKLQMLTYLGSSKGVEEGRSIAFGPDGSLVVGGFTYASSESDFPLKNPMASSVNANGYDGFLTCLSLDHDNGAAAIRFSTFLGGNTSAGATSNLRRVLVDDTGRIHVVGDAALDSFSGARSDSQVSVSQIGTADGFSFVGRIKADGSAFESLTFIGGHTLPRDMALAPDGGEVIFCNGGATGLPMVDPLFATSGGQTDTVILKLSPDAKAVTFSSFLGGSSYEEAGGIAVGSSGSIYLTGNTYSNNFPLMNAQRTTIGDSSKVGFLSVIGFSDVVNSTGDDSDADLSDGTCSTGKTLTNGQTECTLRARIQTINAKGTSPDKQGIQFNIVEGVPNGTIPKIALKTPLPSIDVPVTLDGTSQPGTKRVWLNGVTGGVMSALVVAGGDCVVKGLLINQIRGDGILIRTKGGNKIENCWVGLNSNGIADTQTGVVGSGVHILNSPNNIVGGASEDKRCVLSNNVNGVWIDGGKSLNNSVQGCFIGTDVSGTGRAGNGRIGVLVGAATKQKTVSPLNAQIGGAAGVPGRAPGNVISSNGRSGLVLVSSSGTRVEGNLIGTDKTGSRPLGNNIGLQLLSAPDNIIGASPNVVSSNIAGIALFNIETSGNRVQNNFIGTDISGLKPIPNNQGIVLVGAKGNFIGTGGRNIVSGNTDVGIRLVYSVKFADGTSAAGVPFQNAIANNWVGLDKSGAKALPNTVGISLEGVDAGSLGNTFSSNVVSGNTNVGIAALRSASNRQGNTTGNTFSANLIGTDASGTRAVPNARFGVLLQDVANSDWDSNTISGNGLAGVLIAGKYPPGFSSGISTTPGSYAPYNNKFTNNFIGTDRTGSRALANGARATNGSGAGVLILANTNANRIGIAGNGNVLSGNAGAGVLFSGDTGNPPGDSVQGNFIGTGKGGKGVLPNFGSGVLCIQSSGKVGGMGAGEGNTIAFNGGDGVTIGAPSGNGYGNRILGNAIFSNKKLGIDLGNNGVTPNRATGTPDAKLPNSGQNYPELVSAKVASGATNVEAVLKGAPKATYRIEFFVNASRDPSGFGEGQKFVGSLDVITDSSGKAAIKVTLPFALSGTQFLSMTATDAKGNTSEFSGLSRTISGQVFRWVPDPNNAKATIKQGIANVRVERRKADGTTQEVTGTDANGFYAFIGVPEGTWTIKPSATTGGFDIGFDPVSKAVTLSVKVPSTSGVDFVTYSISGVVKGSDGKPLVGAPVHLMSSTRTVKTDTNGVYLFDGLGKGEVGIEFGDDFSPTFGTVTLPTKGISGVSPNGKLDAQRGLSVSGRVVDAAGKPLVGVNVLYRGAKSSGIVTDENGAFTVSGLVPGSYTFAVEASAGKFSPANRSVVLSDKNITDVNFVKANPSADTFSGGDS